MPFLRRRVFCTAVTSGRAGELLVAAHEKAQLMKAGLTHLAEMVERTAEVEGDGAGFDVRSFHMDGSPKFIEVKTTRGDASTDFYVSRNEVAFLSGIPRNSTSIGALVLTRTEVRNFMSLKERLTGLTFLSSPSNSAS
jgi:uncharacterized protein DUF3883